MAPTILPPDTQATYRPVWFMSCAQFPRVIATRDIDIPFVVPGTIFTVGDSVVGGEDLVGGGAGPQFKQAFRGILNTPVVTRSIGDPAWPMVQVSDVTVELLNENGELNGDWRAAPFTLSAYDAESGFLLLTGSFVVAQGVHDRRKLTITGKNFDESILEAQIPKGVITLAEFPWAAPDAIGQTPTWLFGNVPNLPLPNVRDDQVKSQFDYVLCRDTAAALTGLRRVMPGGANPFIAMTSDELEPYPGMDGVLVNGNFESWDAGAASAPDGWVLSGAGATVAKNTTAGQFDEGSASASVTRVGATVTLAQDLMANAPTLPLSWWQGREITMTARVRASVAATVFIRLIDSVSTLGSANHSGSGLFETLSVTYTVNAAATSLSAQLRIITTDQTVQIDDVRIFLHALNMNECLRPELYPGYTAIRTFLRQEDASGSLFQLAADVHGLQPERNPVRALRSIASSQAHALGQMVSDASFDAGEIAIAMSYQDLVLTDAPRLLLDFDEASEATVALDTSGCEHHGVYHPEHAYPSSNPDFRVNGVLSSRRDGAIAVYAGDATSDDSWVDVPYYNSAYSPTATGWTFEMLYQPRTDAGGGVMDTTHTYPLAELLVGTASGTGPLRLSQFNGTIVAEVLHSGGLASASVALSSLHLFAWLHVVVKLDALTGGAVTLEVTIVNGGDGEPTLSGTAAYAGTIASGDGKLLIAKYGTGFPGGAPGKALGYFDKVGVYLSVLSAARLTARRTWINAILNGGGPQIAAPSRPRADLTALPSGTHQPTHLYMLDDTATATMFDQGAPAGAIHGTFVGAPTLNAPGYLPNQYTGDPNQGVSFENNVAKYAQVLAITPNGLKGSWSVWVKPDAQKAPSGIFEYAIGGVRNTSISLCQTGAGTMQFRVKDATGALKDVAVPVLPEDVGRYMHLRLGYDNGVQMLKKNNATLATGTYTSPVTVASSTLYIGVQGTNGGPLTRPGQGDIDDLAIYDNYALTDADGDWIYTSGTWQFGGLCVDAALREPRAARAWLTQICLIRGIRLGMTPEGPITVTVDAAPATTIRLHARDGAGDGERTIVDIGDLIHGPPLDEAVATLVVRGRRDLLSNAFLVERRRTIGVLGKEDPVEFDCVREYPTLDRIASYLAGRRIAGKKKLGTLVMGQAARQLMEAELVMVTDANLGLAGEIMEVQEIGKSISTHTAKVQRWSETPYTWVPESYPSGATSG